MPDKIKTAVNGVGIIGMRAAEAVSVQPDMELVGVADISTSAIAKLVYEKFPVYASTKDALLVMKDAGINVQGTLDNLLEQAAIVVDATPKGLPQKNFELYARHGVKVIIEGGEKHELAGHSSSSFANYESALYKDRTRVVSCNTTALARILSKFNYHFGIDNVAATLIRRAEDPVRGSKGITNSVVPVLGASHHYDDVTTVLPDLEGKGYSLAVAVPDTLSHVHTLYVEFGKNVTEDNVAEVLNNSPRIRVIYGERDGLRDTAEIAELYRNMGRPRYDHPEITVWKDAIHVNGRKAYLIFDVHNESIPIPENVDAIRAMAGTELKKWVAIRATDFALDSILPRFAKPAEIYRN